MAIAAPFPSVRSTRSTSSTRSTHTAGSSAGAAAGTVRLTRRGRVVIFAVASMALSAAIISTGQFAGAADSAPSGPATSVVVVQSGESLWSIAQRVAPGADPRETVIRLRELNGLGNAIVVPGQSIVVPA